MDVNDYLVDHRGFDWRTILSDWVWVLPESFTVWLMNRFGDLFIVLEDGSVHWFDVGGATLKRIADSRDDFCKKIDEDNNANDWLMIPLVDRLVAAGITVGAGQCYSYRKPPLVGGDYTVENTAVLDIKKHYGFYGSIYEQMKDVPDGDTVEFVIVNKPMV
jgi:hypothetical protein